jgi:hypothetical protein
MEMDVSKAGRQGLKNLRVVIAGASLLAVSMLALAASEQSPTTGTAQLIETAAARGAEPVDGQSEQLSRKIAELDVILADKKQLEEALRVEKSAQSAASLQVANAKKLIRLEIEDFFAQTTNRTRLDSLLEDYARSVVEEEAAQARLQAVEKDLGDRQLKFLQAARDVDRLKAQLASEERKRNSKKVQAIAQRLDKNIYFNESVSFRCSTTKSLAACLGEYRHDERMSRWVQEHYERVLAEEIRDQVATLKLDPNWYNYRTRSEFSEASMSLDGTVSAQVTIQASVTAKKMMSCAILDVPYELCDSKSHSLIVRSNKFNDQVIINEQNHGSTPVSLMLDSGEYEVQVVSEGITQKRTLALKGDQVINFKF